MEIIFIIGATLSFFLAFLVFSKKNKITGDYILGAYLVVLGLYYIIIYLGSIAIEYPGIMGIIGFNAPLILGAFIFLYVLLMVKTNNKFKAVYWLHGLPFLLFNLYFIFYFYFPGEIEKGTFYYITYERVNFFKIIFYLTINPIYAIWSLFLLMRHKQKILNDFSYTEQIDLFWLKYVVLGFMVFVIVLLITHLFKFQIIAFSPLGYVIYFTLTLYMFFLGYFGLKQQAIYNDKQIDLSLSDNVIPINENGKGEHYKRSTLKEKEAEVYLENLLNYFEKEKPYLNGQLNLADLSEYLNISVHHLSQIINERLGKRFFDFVNEYRVQEVKTRLSNAKHEQYTLLSIAYDSGFNSKSCFNSTFKKITGFTPSQYLKQQML